MELAEIDVLVLDCQASGATPAHGDLLELGWMVTGASGARAPVRAHWTKPRDGLVVPRAVRELTGWSDACLETAIPPLDAWPLLFMDAERLRRGEAQTVPTVIHFARFELPFLRDLHARASGAQGDAMPTFPFDTICLHAIAQRLFPDLPRRNMRALAGFLGHSPELMRRAAGHVEASAFIWRALVPRLAEQGITTWPALHDWLATKRPPSSRAPRARGSRRGFPLAAEKRRALPDAPGVYRFVRSNGDVLYVGKATSLKKRVASHFTGSGRATERSLEMLSQAHDVVVTETPSILEAALLETDEIKRIDPPYNVHLRVGERNAWFASPDWSSAEATPSDEHPVGPLPSRVSLAGIGALLRLLEGAEAHDGIRAAAVSVPRAFAPERSLFESTWRAFVAEHFSAAEGAPASARARILAASRRVVVSESDPDEPPDAEWDEAAVRRHLERTLAGGGLLVRRAVRLTLLADSDVYFREAKATSKELRRLVIEAAEITHCDAVDENAASGATRLRPQRRSRRERQAVFDAQRYDRLRVIATELRRIHDQGGLVVVRVGTRLVR